MTAPWLLAYILSAILIQLAAGSALGFGRPVTQAGAHTRRTLRRIAGGIGITPIMSMILWLLEACPGRAMYVY